MGGVLTEPVTVGFYGAILTGTLFLIATWRLTAHLFGYCTGCGGSGGGGRAEGMTMRRSFHSLLWSVSNQTCQDSLLLLFCVHNKAQ